MKKSDIMNYYFVLVVTIDILTHFRSVAIFSRPHTPDTRCNHLLMWYLFMSRGSRQQMVSANQRNTHGLTLTLYITSQCGYWILKKPIQLKLNPGPVGRHCKVKYVTLGEVSRHCLSLFKVSRENLANLVLGNMVTVYDMKNIPIISGGGAVLYTKMIIIISKQS